MLEDINDLVVDTYLVSNSEYFATFDSFVKVEEGIIYTFQITRVAVNRHFIKLHAMEADEVVYKVKYPYAEIRHLYFISDSPHLIKTVGNWFSSRQLWV